MLSSGVWPFFPAPHVIMNFCGGQREGDKHAESRCEKQFQQKNDTINAIIKVMTNSPELPDQLFKMDLLPDTLLPISTNSINPKHKQRFGELCTKAFQFAEGRDPSIAVAEERNLTRAKEEYYQHKWCEAGHDKCTSGHYFSASPLCFRHVCPGTFWLTHVSSRWASQLPSWRGKSYPTAHLHSMEAY